MTASVQQLRDAIAAKIASVTNVGKVHPYERYAKSPSALATLYVSSAQGGNRILGWYVRRVSTREILIDTGRNYMDHGWRVRGFMSLEDADETEEKFDTLIEAIRTAFRADPSLGGLCETYFNEAGANQAGVQLEEHAPVLFAGVLCHSARLSLTTRVYI